MRSNREDKINAFHDLFILLEKLKLASWPDHSEQITALIVYLAHKDWKNR
jgi:hypothetical protein